LIPSKDKLTSEFNEAGLQIQRLNYIWQSCNHLGYTGQLEKWNWQLDRAYIELSNDIWDEDGEERSKKKDSHYQKIMQINSDIDRFWNDKKKLYKILTKKEQILRKIQDASGKGSRKERGYVSIMD